MSGIIIDPPDQGDRITRLRSSWSETMPDVDTGSIEVFGRIGRIAALADVCRDRTLAEVGLTRSEFEVLCVLSRTERPMRASELVAEIRVSGAAATKITAHLERLELINRERHDRDGRVVLLSITPSGRELVVREFPDCMTFEHDLLLGLDDAEQAALSALLERVLTEVEQAAEPGE
ncbi:MarR family winged helix-turn-helix transcriptional regulator [Microbacterium gorillae]|uniref:MarR family winged helix-turn-helix transcriptional regulator n=1 Tax=Microbacterium gorillae TaxID=1231063 RepID=UPI00069472A3|nr:MarR family transcriptional regulator [Microbacterium gorillae]